MKLIAKLKSFKQYFGMTAELLNNDGDVIDTITIGEDGKGKKLKFKFDEDDLNGSNNVELVFADNNGNDKNFESGDDTFDMNPDDQDFDVTIKSNKKKTKAKIKLIGDELSDEDTTGPVFTSGATATASETITAGTTVYTATATDDSPPVSFSLSGTDAGSFSISAQGQVSINASPDFATKSSYSFNVVGTDAVGNSTTQAVALSITQTPVGDTINLTTFQDVYDDATGTTVNGAGVQTPRTERLSSLDNAIVGTAGELGQADSLSDPSTSDSDTLTIATSAAASNLQNSLAAVQNITNVENLVVNASNDDSAAPDFAQVIQTDSLDINGFFTANVALANFFDSAQISSFDFSGSTNPNIGFTVNPATNAVQAFSNEPLTLIGSPGADTLIASLAAVTAIGGAGDDTINGSTNAASTIEGGNGQDTVTLTATNAATDFVDYNGITLETNDTDITGFIGFNNAVNAAQDQHDILRFDASTYTNYTAGTQVTQRAVADIFNVLGTAAADNVFLVDNLAAVLANAAVNFGNLSLHGKSWLLLDNTNGQIHYAADGNFNNSQDIGSIDDFANFVAQQNVNIV